MKARAIFISGILLTAFGLGLIAYGHKDFIVENIPFKPMNTQINTSYEIISDKFHISSLTNGIGTYIIELTNPISNASIQQDKVSLQIQEMGGQVIKRYISTVNAMLVALPRDRVMSLAYNPDIKRVYEDKPIGYIPDEEYENGTGIYYNTSGEWTGKGVTVFVIDSGINGDLPQFDGSVKIRYTKYGSYYTHWHGTMCGYIIHKIAPDSTLASVCVFNDDGNAWISDLLDAADYVAMWHAQHPDKFAVVSCSFGIKQENWHGGGWRNPCIICEAYNSLAHMGIPVVVAAGNDGPDSRTIECPGQAQFVLTVGAVDSQKHIAYFSSRGPTTDGNRKPDVVSYGVDIAGIDSEGNPIVASGTSFSTPMVAAAIALLGEKYGNDYTPEQYYNAIRQSAEDLGEPGYDYDYGYGFVNVTNAFNVMVKMTPQNLYDEVGIPIFAIGLMFMSIPAWRRK